METVRVLVYRRFFASRCFAVSEFWRYPSFGFLLLSGTGALGS